MTRPTQSTDSRPVPDPAPADRGAIAIERFTLGPWQTNCYLVHTGQGGAGWIVDASFGPAPLLARAKDLALTIEKIVLTHAHVDHIAGLSEARSAFPGTSVLLHEAEREWLGNPMLNLSEGAGIPITSGDADVLLRGGETLTLGDSSWRVLHTPGHSPGGIALVNDADRVALVGDTLFDGSIGRSDFPTSDPRALTDSIRESLYRLPDDTRVLPGHMSETTIGKEKLTNPFVRESGLA